MPKTKKPFHYETAFLLALFLKRRRGHAMWLKYQCYCKSNRRQLAKYAEYRQNHLKKITPQAFCRLYAHQQQPKEEKRGEC